MIGDFFSSFFSAIVNPPVLTADDNEFILYFVSFPYPHQTPLKEVIGNFLEYIQFHKIPANVLMREIHPLGLIPYSIIMNALAYQADPSSVDPATLSPNASRVRRARQGRSMSVQSSFDPYGSNTTLSSSGSSGEQNGSRSK